MNPFLFSIIVIAACFGIFYLFMKKQETLQRQENIPQTSGTPEGEVTDVIYQEISKLNVPSFAKSQVSQTLAKIVDQEIHKKTVYVSQQVEKKYTKVLEEKTKEVKVITQKYEATEKKYEGVVKEKKQTEAVMKSIAEGLVVVNEKGETLLMNPAAEKILGVSKENLVGKNVASAQKEGKVISLAQQTPGKEESEITVVSEDDNTKRVIRSSTAVIQNESGQTVGMVSVLTDVTKQKELDELKNKFVSNVSHELRAPMNCIKESINLLLERFAGDVNAEQQKILELAKRNIVRLSDLINDLLDLAKLESKEYKLKYSTFRLEGLLHQVVATFEAWAKSKKVSLDFKSTPASIEIEADHDKIIQILTNLVSNALKFTPENGNIVIDAKLLLGDTPGAQGYVQVTVQDSGVGMTQEDIKKLFQKFVQVSSATKTTATGTGLGLAIIKEICDMHGGRVWVESEIDKGSRFMFVLPQRNPKPEATQDKQPQAA